jgi:hypothetical protein
MVETLIIAGMRDRVIRLHRIADMTHNKEMRDLILNVASDIEAEIRRLESADDLPTLKMPLQPQA